MHKRDVGSMVGAYKDNLCELLQVGVKILLLITVICVFVPFSPTMPEATLDSSWTFGMNQAVAQGLSFGRDVIFTFGPYASIYTKSFHPATDHLMLYGSLYFAVSYWLALFFLTKDKHPNYTLLFVIVIAGLTYSPDALFFSYPLLAGLICFEIANDRAASWKKPLTLAFTVVIFLPFGLLPLIKGSLLILCLIVAGLTTALFFIQKRIYLALAVVVTPLVSIVLFWIASEQSAHDLPAFFINLFPIISGYTEAMASDGSVREIVYFLIAASYFLITILCAREISLNLRAFLFSVFCAFLFLAFKGGFVRHDAHALMSGTSILMGALLLFLTFRSRQTMFVLIVSFLVWAYIDSHHVKTNWETVLRNLRLTYASAWEGLKNRTTMDEWPVADFNNSIKMLKDEARFPLLLGTTDIYSYKQSYLIASGNKWNPRPILQSYSVYTTSLAAKNRAHLNDETAPDNVIFRVEPIDARLPSLEDGESWPPLLSNYQPTAFNNDFLYLQRRSTTGTESQLSVIGDYTYKLGEKVDLPHTLTPIFAEVTISPSVLGKMANLLFKPTQLRIHLKLENGTSKTYRIIAGMAKSTFLISPLVEDTMDFSLLYSKNNYLDNKRVNSFSISADGNERFWHGTYKVIFRQFVSTSKFDLTKLHALDEVLDRDTIVHISNAEACSGSIDIVNGVSPPSNEPTITISGLLTVGGWLAKSAEEGTVPRSTFVVLTDKHGMRNYIETKPVSRVDVGMHFKKPSLNESGFKSTVDVSDFNGDYILGLAYRESDNIKLCPQFKTPIKIKQASSHARN